MKRIGLTQRVDVVADYGERRDCLDQSWTRLLWQLQRVPIALSNAVDSTSEYLDALQLSGVILTGGNDLTPLAGEASAAPERDRFEKRLIADCLDRGVPILGVCRGMQVINDYFGGTISLVEGHVAKRHRVRGVEGVFQAWADSFEVNSYHNYAISPDGLADSMVVAAIAEDETVEAFRHPKDECYGVMWHPERERPFADRDLSMLRAVFMRGGE
jgi:putative glutamine amidotransferase